MSEPYRPLPASLTIAPSPIDGLGLFAVNDIPKMADLGISHVETHDDRLIRTPLGGFINHSNDPNCSKTWHWSNEIDEYRLITVKYILAGEELTLSYDLVDPPT